VGFIRRHPILTAILTLALVVVGVLSATAVAVWQAAHTDDARRIDHADVILVLGAAEYSGRPSPVFAGRLEQAKLLFQQGRAGSILVLGGKRPGDVTTEADAGRAYLLAHGVSSEDVFAEPTGNTTFESLQAAARFMRGMALHSASLVSDPWHNLRIKRMAGDLGIQAYASATWHSAARSTATRLAGYMRETFAYLAYRLFGGH
jgi:uncharacterized SAM-binding protein YcdF (DUF218 family)